MGCCWIKHYSLFVRNRSDSPKVYAFLPWVRSVLMKAYSIGTVLCSPTELVPLVTKFVAQVIIFDIEVPITVGTSVGPNSLRVYFC